MRRGRVVTLFLAALLVGGGLSARPGRARAESAEQEVERLADEAVEAYKATHYEEAVRLLTRAYAIRPLTPLLYNLARAEDKLGHAERARESYARYVVAEDAEPKLAKRAEERIAALDEQLRKKRAAEVPVEPVRPPPVARPAAPVAPVGPTPAELQRRADDDLARRKRIELGVGVGVAALGLGAIGAGVGFWAVTRGKQSDFTDSRDEQRKRQLRDEAATPALLSTVMYAAGGVLLAGSVYFFYAGLRPERAAPARTAALAPSVVPWLGVATVGGSASWRF